MTLKFKKLSENAVLPRYAHDGDSGMDICALHGGTVPAGGTAFFETGIAFELPWMIELQVRPRSGLARKSGVFAVYGTVDSGYRGDIGVTLVNVSGSDYEVKAGDRIAQLVVAVVPRAQLIEVKKFYNETDRGESGFGSTGR